MLADGVNISCNVHSEHEQLVCRLLEGAYLVHKTPHVCAHKPDSYVTLTHIRKEAWPCFAYSKAASCYNNCRFLEMQHMTAKQSGVHASEAAWQVLSCSTAELWMTQAAPQQEAL